MKLNTIVSNCRILAAAGFLLSILPACAQAAKYELTPERLLDIALSPSPRPGSFAWFPDSRRFLFAIAEPGKNGAHGETWIETMDIESGQRTRLVPGSDPRLSPDGSMVAFVLTEGKQRWLKLYTISTRETKSLIPLPPGYDGSNFGFAWSRDSRSLACGYRPERPPAHESTKNAPKQSTVFVMGGQGDIPPDSQVWVIDVATGAKREIRSGPFDFRFPGWLPDGRVVYSEVGTFDYRNDNLYGKVVSVDSKTRKLTLLVANSGVQHLSPVPSPDGKEIAFRYDPNDVFYPYYDNIATIPADGGPIHQWSRDIFVLGSPVWAPDSSRIYFGCKDGAYSRICSVTHDGTLEKLTQPTHNIGNIAISPDGKTLLYSYENIMGSFGIAETPAAGGPERVIDDSTPANIRETILGHGSVISWKASDGLTLHGFLIRPADYTPSRRYPLLVDLHGGPIGGVPLMGSILLKTPLEWHMWAAKGYIVLVPDYRTGEITGWGPLLAARERQDYNVCDMGDIMAGVDKVLADYSADPKRMALIGHSNGSYLTNWIITHSRRFRVAVSYEGFADQYLAYGAGLRVGGNKFSEWMFKGLPWDVPQNYRANSPDEFVKGVTTPTLFISNDYSGGSGMVNMFHHEFMYTALKKQGVDTEMLVYRGESHVIMKPENLKDLLTRVVAWVDGHMPAEGAE
jgi:dipeptidyl aminopeptidase/acylaminoacyl peptidase